MSTYKCHKTSVHGLIRMWRYGRARTEVDSSIFISPVQTEDLYAEYEKLVRHCLKGHPTSQPKLQEPAPGLWNRFIDYMKWPVVKVRDIKDAIIRRFKSDKASSV